ncbi:hypothetical protein JADG_006250 [Aureobasidium aubasidani]|nr:hypothetical protein JADG_006250 [Aureobasidium pullulans]
MMASDNRSSWSTTPFGYEFPYQPNDPPSGPPLLDQDESTTLQNFFSDPDHYGGPDSMPESILANLNTLPDSSFQQFDQLSDTQWMYPTSDQSYPVSYPTQEQAYQYQNGDYSQRTFQIPKDPKDLLAIVGIPEANASADVLHAASTLFSYRANSTQGAQGNPGTHRLGSGSFPAPVAQQQPMAQHESRHASFPFTVPTATSSSTSQYPSTNGHFRASFDNSTTNVNSLPHSHSSSSHQSSTPMFHFGTDNNFRQSGYAAPYQGLEDALTQQQVDFARNMVHSSNDAMSSVENSVPHTPDLTRGTHSYYPANMQPFATLADQTSTGESDRSKTKKRRKFKIPDGDEFDTSITSPAFQVNNNSSPDGDNTVADSDDNDGESNNVPKSTGKRRRASSGANSKLSSIARKNLTEDQKRSNHIRSEQKRRNIIKQGYEDLNEIVPNLKTGGFSKSAVLTETTRYLEEIDSGNNAMEKFLRKLAAQRGINFDDML